MVLTTREFSRLLKREGVWLADIKGSEYDNHWMSEYTGAAVIFGATGGVMEAALRTVYAVVNGKELEGIDIKAVRGLEGFREAELDLGGDYGRVKVGIATGLKAARDILEKMKKGEVDDYIFIEVMACPGGCISGGGQPRIKGEYQDNK